MGLATIFIGIAGGSGSGKTHLSHEVQRLVGKQHVSVLSMDRYFRTESCAVASDVNFDHPAHLDLDLMAEHLDGLRRGEAIKAPTYNFQTMIQKPESEELAPSPVILVEGLFALATPIAERLEFTCFLDVESDQRLLGRLLRDRHERGASLLESVDRYQRFVRPSYNVFVAPTKQNADIVVDFTYRRSFFTGLLAELLKDYVTGGYDIQSLLARMRTDHFRIGYKAEEEIMPMSIDIRELARAFPEHVVQHPPDPLLGVSNMGGGR